jgi:hypothetical protein
MKLASFATSIQIQNCQHIDLLNDEDKRLKFLANRHASAQKKERAQTITSSINKPASSDSIKARAYSAQSAIQMSQQLITTQQ